jgi:hypothetical protein
MQVSKETLAEWHRLSDRGDVSHLVGVVGLSYPTVYNMWKTGKGKSTYIAKIIAFYNKRKRLVGETEDDAA